MTWLTSTGSARAAAGAVSSAGAEAVPGSSPISAGRAGAYVELCRLVLWAGLLAKRPGYYRMRIGVVLGLWTAGWAGFALLGRSWWQLAVAAFLAVVFAQVGFLCHDAGHRQVFIARHSNDRLGLLCGNLLIGLSRGWWTDLHDRHHAYPDQVGRCPDIAGAGGRPGRARLVESVLLAVHFGGYLGAVFLVLPVGQAVAFIAVHRGMLGVYLGCWFALSHRGMPPPRTDERLDFLRRQVLTRRNIHGRRWPEVAMGGLNHQIEHHLFPSMPSPTLRAARPLVRAFCLRHELPYHEITLASAHTRAPRHLRGDPSTKDHPTERS